MKISKRGFDGDGDFVLTRMYSGAGIWIEEGVKDLTIENWHLQNCAGGWRVKCRAMWAAFKFIWASSNEA